MLDDPAVVYDDMDRRVGEEGGPRCRQDHCFARFAWCGYGGLWRIFRPESVPDDPFSGIGRLSSDVTHHKAARHPSLAFPLVVCRSQRYHALSVGYQRDAANHTHYLS